MKKILIGTLICKLECKLYLNGENNHSHEELSSSFHEREGPTHCSDLILDIGQVQEI